MAQSGSSRSSCVVRSIFKLPCPPMAPIVAVKIASAPEQHTDCGLESAPPVRAPIMASKARKGSDSTDTTGISQFDGETSTREWRAAPTENIAADARAIRFVRQGLSLYELNSRVAALRAMTCSSMPYLAQADLLFPSFHSSKSSRSGAMPTELPVISAVRAPSSAKAPNSSNLLDDLCLLGIIDLAQGAGWAGLLALLPDRGRHLARFWRP